MIGVLKLSIIHVVHPIPSFCRRGFSTLVPSCASTASDTPWAMLCVRIAKQFVLDKYLRGRNVVQLPPTYTLLHEMIDHHY